MIEYMGNICGMIPWYDKTKFMFGYVKLPHHLCSAMSMISYGYLWLYFVVGMGISPGLCFVMLWL